MKRLDYQNDLVRGKLNTTGQMHKLIMNFNTRYKKKAPLFMRSFIRKIYQR